MNRRDILRAGAVVVGSAASAGCTEYRLQEAEREPPPSEPIPKEEFDLPVPQRLAIAEEGIERAADADIRDLGDLAAYLDEHGIRVEKLAETVEEGTPLLELEYVVETVEDGLMLHLGVVAGGYAALIEATRESEKLEAHLLGPDGEPFGEYEIRRRWAEKYNDGEYTPRKYADEIAVTAAST